MSSGMPERIREQDPLKQGLKQSVFLGLNLWISIREQDPLKQGLKLIIFLAPVFYLKIREQDPLKQGLKLTKCLSANLIILKFVSKIH